MHRLAADLGTAPRRSAVTRTQSNTVRTLGAIIKRARLDKGWSQHELMHALRDVALQKYNHVLPTNQSFKPMLSRWENNWRIPDDYHRRLLGIVLDLDLDELPAEVVEATRRAH